jgi:hypothetical protein
MSGGGEANPLSCLLWLLAIAGVIYVIIAAATGNL